MSIVRLSKKVPIQSLESVIAQAANNIGWQLKIITENSNRKYMLINPQGKKDHKMVNIYIPKTETMPRWFSIGEKYTSSKKMRSYLQNLHELINI
nr:hypothetical protein [Candidatus Woesearchaeota archaeon]